MRGFWVLVHVLGFTLWLGGGIATMVAGVSAKSFAPAERLSAYKLIGAIQRILVGPGAMAVLLSGLVDFYGKLDGKEIFWCWKQGEERIEFWHDLETGYAGRQPIPEVVNSQ